MGDVSYSETRDTSHWHLPGWTVHRRTVFLPGCCCVCFVCLFHISGSRRQIAVGSSHIRQYTVFPMRCTGKMLFCSFLAISAEPAFLPCAGWNAANMSQRIGKRRIEMLSHWKWLNKSGARRPELGAIIHRAVEGSLPPRDLSQSETQEWSAFGTGIRAAFVIIAGSAAALLCAAGV